jgi:hypothetical protein
MIIRASKKNIYNKATKYVEAVTFETTRKSYKAKRSSRRTLANRIRQKEGVESSQWNRYRLSKKLDNIPNNILSELLSRIDFEHTEQRIAYNGTHKADSTMTFVMSCYGIDIDSFREQISFIESKGWTLEQFVQGPRVVITATRIRRDSGLKIHDLKRAVKTSLVNIYRNITVVHNDTTMFNMKSLRSDITTQRSDRGVVDQGLGNF